MRREVGTSDGGMDIDGEAQGVRVDGCIRYRYSELGRGTVHVTVSTQSQVGVSGHDSWKQGTTIIFDVQIVNLSVGSYLHTMPEEVLTKV